MQDFARQADVALNVYLRRGQKAIALLEKGLLAQALKLLALQKAAFHNFRVAEALCGDDPRMSGLNDNWRKLWQEVASMEAQLIALVEEKRDQLGMQFNKVRAQKVKINKFRSKQENQAIFARNV